MKLYRVECAVWIRGETIEDAINELHDEMGALLEADNNLIAIVSDEDGVEDVEGEPT